MPDRFLPSATNILITGTQAAKSSDSHPLDEKRRKGNIGGVLIPSQKRGGNVSEPLMACNELGVAGAADGRVDLAAPSPQDASQAINPLQGSRVQLLAL